MNNYWIRSFILIVFSFFYSLGDGSLALAEETLKDPLAQSEVEFETLESQDPQMTAEPSTPESSGPAKVDSQTRKADAQEPQAQTSDSQEAQGKNDGLPPWGAAQGKKGFISADDDGAYYYKEDAPSSEKNYDEDVVIKPDPKNKERGLLSVASDGSYLYEPEESEVDGGASLRVARLDALTIERNIGVKTITFEEMYGENPRSLIFFDYDIFQGRRWGHWVLSMGLGYAQASGEGYFLSDGSKAQEKYTMHFLTTNISGIYRFQYTSHPWVVPYISVGLSPVTLLELRDDDKRNHLKTIPAAQVSGGLRLNVGNFDPQGVGAMDAEYGINNFWLDAEFKRLEALEKTIDVSSNFVNFGLGFDF